VLIFNTMPSANGAGADVVIGQPNLSTNTANYFGAGAASLYQPFGVFYDGANLYVADTGNNRVLIYNTVPASNGASANFAVGQPDLVTVSTPGGPTAATLWQPRAAKSDGAKLYVADYREGRVLIYSPIPSSNGASAAVALGVPDFVTAGSSATVSTATMASPSGLATDGTRLFIAYPGDN